MDKSLIKKPMRTPNPLYLRSWNPNPKGALEFRGKEAKLHHISDSIPLLFSIRDCLWKLKRSFDPPLFISYAMYWRPFTLILFGPYLISWLNYSVDPLCAYFHLFDSSVIFYTCFSHSCFLLLDYLTCSYSHALFKCSIIWFFGLIIYCLFIRSDW